MDSAQQMADKRILAAERYRRKRPGFFRRAPILRICDSHLHCEEKRGFGADEFYGFRGGVDKKNDNSEMVYRKKWGTVCMPYVLTRGKREIVDIHK